MADPLWLEVSLVVDGELAEAVADVIGRYTSEGIVMEQAVQYNDSEDLGTAYGPIKVYGYLLMDAHVEDKRRHLEEALWHLSQIQPLPALEFRAIEDQDWMSYWKKFYKPIPIGKKLLVLPAWLDSEYPDRLAIRIDPSMAFGTGTHPTTQLMLSLIEKHLKPGDDVIDIGCGTGILSIGALLLGANSALGVDIDAVSVQQSLENAKANNVDDRIKLGLGSVNEVLHGDFGLTQAPVVLANILAPVINRLFHEDHMADVIAENGLILLSGILTEQDSSVIETAKEQGLTYIDSEIQGDWIALVFQK